MPDVGFRKWLGINYDAMEDGHAEISLAITDDMRNQRDVVQGGVIASVIDVAMGTAAGAAITTPASARWPRWSSRSTIWRLRPAIRCPPPPT